MHFSNKLFIKDRYRLFQTSKPRKFRLNSWVGRKFRWILLQNLQLELKMRVRPPKSTWKKLMTILTGLLISTKCKENKNWISTLYKMKQRRLHKLEDQISRIWHSFYHHRDSLTCTRLGNRTSFFRLLHLFLALLKSRFKT